MATVPAHIGTATALTKQKLLASIQNKQLQQSNQQESTEVLAQALKAAIEVSRHFDWCVSSSY